MALTIFGDTPQIMWQKAVLAMGKAASDITAQDCYSLLEKYYYNNGLYQQVDWASEKTIWTDGMKPIRNPANRAVEFHAAHLWPGSLPDALPIVTENERIIAPIQQVWTWSNWGVQKQLAARWYAWFGDLFMKVATSEDAGGKVDKVKLSTIKPEHVIEMELDEFGFITYVRVDVPTNKTENGVTVSYVHTEVWEKEADRFRLFEHNMSAGSSLTDLGDPVEDHPISEFGIDFIPIVHAKFKDVGTDRGQNVFVHALDKIDEANAMATRLHDLLFRYNKPTQAITSTGSDATGKPLPPPTFIKADGTALGEGEAMELSDDELLPLPSNADIKMLVADIKYGDALAILNAQMLELEEDLPEMTYYRMKEKGELSGKAMRTMLSGAVDRALEARGNAETALIRAHQIALTLGRLHSLPGFTDIGTYEEGDYDHQFTPREIIPMTESERAEAVKVDVDAGIPFPVAMKQHGYNNTQITEAMESQEYRLKMSKLLWDAAKSATEAGLPLETYLTLNGFTPEQMNTVGTQKLAAIKLQQEDTIPPVGQ